MHLGIDLSLLRREARGVLLDFNAARAAVSGTLPAPLIFTRAQASGARATAIGADDATWSEFAADVPRFSGSARRLVQEGQRTNLLANTRTPAGAGWSTTAVTPTVITGPDNVAGSAARLDEGTASNTQHMTQHAPVSYTVGLPYTMSAIVRPGTCTSMQLLFSVASHGPDAWQNFN